MKPLSEMLTQLIEFGQQIITRPNMHIGAREAEYFAFLANEVRLADARPAEGDRCTQAALAMVSALEGFFASDREPTSQWLGLAGNALPLLRGQAWRARSNEQEARGS